jgi:CRP/FNR family cyclic AMP-dependent transcriptional regulator
MRTILKHCSGGREIRPSANTLLIHEGEKSGYLYVLIEGSLEVLKGDTVVATTAEPGAIFGEMSVLLDRPHSATVRATSDSRVYEFDDAAAFLRSQPEIALLVARLLAHRLSAATTYLADIKRQYGGRGDHLAMVGEILESLVSLVPTNVSPGSDRQPDPRR